MLNKAHVWSACLLAYCFFPLLWIAQYNYPSGDDYVQYSQAHSLGTLAAVRWWYRNWTGRYASFFIQSSFPNYETWLRAYKIIPVVLFVVSFGCLIYLVRAFFGPRLAHSLRFAFASLFFIVLVSLTPDIATAFYWLPTNVQNVGAVFTTLLLLGLYIDVGEATRPGIKTALWLAIALLVATLAGLNEISLLFFFGTIALTALLQLRRSGRLPREALAVLALALAFGLVALLAPGNALRVSHLGSPGHLAAALLRAFGLTVYQFGQLLSMPALFLASAIYLAFLGAHRDHLDRLWSWLASVRWYWIPVVLFALTFASLIPVTIAGLRAVPDRVANVYAYTLILGWFFALTVLYANFASAERRLQLPTWALALLTVALAIFLLTGFGVRWAPESAVPNASRMQTELASLRTKSVYTNAYLDLLSGRAALYAEQNQETTMRFTDDACVEFPALEHIPDTIFVRFVKYPWTWCPDYVRLHWPSPP